MASHQEAFVTKWTDFLSNLFVSLLIEEVKKRNCTSCTYNKAGCNNIQAEFNKQIRLHYTLVQLKNRVNKLKKQFSSFKKLLSQSGFGWDNINKTVIVNDPSVWEAHVKDNSELAKFKKDGFPHHPDPCIVFGDAYATGDYAAGNVEDRVASKGDNNGGCDDIGDAISDPKQFNEHQVNEGVFTPNVATTPVYGKHKLDRTPNSKRRRKSNTFDVNGCCKAIQDMIKFRTS